MRALLYIDGRVSSHYNTGSDLFPQKEQRSYMVVNGRVGLADRDHRWSVEFWAQNLFNKDYAQVAFNSPFQAGGSTTPPWAPGFTFAPFVDPQYPGSRQLFSMFLAEPRTFGLTLRARSRLSRTRRRRPMSAPPPPPPPPPGRGPAAAAAPAGSSAATGEPGRTRQLIVCKGLGRPRPAGRGLFLGRLRPWRVLRRLEQRGAQIVAFVAARVSYRRDA